MASAKLNIQRSAGAQRQKVQQKSWFILSVHSESRFLSNPGSFFRFIQNPGSFFRFIRNPGSFFRFMQNPGSLLQTPVQYQVPGTVPVSPLQCTFIVPVTWMIYLTLYASIIRQHRRKSHGSLSCIVTTLPILF